jgi:hypothetical protein
LAGYSGTPLARKLGIRTGDAVAVVGAPAGWSIPELPDAVAVRTRTRGAPDVIIAFFTRCSDLERRLPALVDATSAEASLWIAWPRKAAGHVSDITENGLRELILPSGLVDTKVAALDEDWSGLRFVWRKELRKAVSARSPRSA